MTALVDTSVLIDHLRGHQGARHTLTAAADRGERLAASVVSNVEVLAGMRASEEAATRRLLSILDWIPVDDVIADQAGRWANRFLRAYPGVDAIDYIIAATADVLGAQLWTRNLKHFPMFPELISPY